MATVLSGSPRSTGARRVITPARTITLQVVALAPAARDAVTLTLALPGGWHSPGSYRAGQFITLTIPTASGAPLYRSYSLCDDGGGDTPWRITVKRTPGGKVSNYLIDRIQPGMVLQASPPQGNFTLPRQPQPSAPYVFVAGGSGITPIYAMLRAIARMAPAERPRVTLHYAYRSPDDAIFGRELLALDPQRAWLTQYHYVTTQGRRLNAAKLVSSLGVEAAGAHWYVCGPATLRHELESAARQQVPAAHLHAEVFASPAIRPTGQAATGKAARIHLADSGATLQAQPGETLLETLERCGYRPDFSCRAGACATCRLRVVSGKLQASGENDALTAAERAQGYVLSCVAQPAGNVTLATAGRQVASPRQSAAGGARRRPAARLAARRSLRAGAAAAAIGVFVGVWGLAHSSATTASAVTSGSSSSSSSSSSTNGASGASSGGSSDSSSSSNATNSGSGGSSSSGSSSNSGSITIQPGLGGSNSSTGVS